MSTDNLYPTPSENALTRLQEGYVRYQIDIQKNLYVNCTSDHD